MYKIIKNTFTGEIDCIARLKDSVYIPLDEANIDYQAYLAWVAEQNQTVVPKKPKA